MLYENVKNSIEYSSIFFFCCNAVILTIDKITKMTTFIKAKLKISDSQMNIYKHGV